MNKTRIEWCELIPGNRIITTDGYVIVHCPNHPQAKANGYVLEHRLVMENHLKRFLESHEHVHHINGVRNDNVIENLELTTNSEHRKNHWLEMSQENKIIHLQRLHEGRRKQRFPRELIACECGCGQFIENLDSKGRKRRFVHGHNQRNKNWKWGATNESNQDRVG